MGFQASSSVASQPIGALLSVRQVLSDNRFGCGLVRDRMNCRPLTWVRSSVPTESSRRSVRVEWTRSIARAPRLDCDVAIKIHPDAMMRDVDRVARIQRQAGFWRIEAKRKKDAHEG